MSNKKPSGFQFRQERKRKEEESKKLSGSLSKFLKTIPNSSVSSTSLVASTSSCASSLISTSSDPTLTSITEVSFPKSLSNSPPALIDTNIDTNINVDNNSRLVQIEQFEDPGLWPDIISEDFRTQMIDHGVPKQIMDFEFPLDLNNRCFSTSLYTRTMANGEKVFRNWLVYSKSKNAVFCFPCSLYKRNENKLSSSSGYSDWSNIYRVTKDHEQTKKHLEAFKSWQLFANRMISQHTIDFQNKKILSIEETHWRNVFKRIILIVKYLSQQNLAFRGKSNTLYTPNNGNFLQLVQMIAEFDSIMAEHLRRFVKQESGHHYLSNIIQNELLSTMSKLISDSIISSVNSNKYFAIIVDATPDISHQEQLTIVVRFVSYKNNQFKICEHFLGFIKENNKTGAAIANTILNFLSTNNLDVQNLRGQGYDNGSNMKGKNNGVQQHILNKNPLAFFVPCACHSLNLIVNDAADASLESFSFFSLIQEIFNFFSRSPNRWDILKKHLNNSDYGLTPKNVSATRWSSRLNAVKALRYNLSQIYDSFLEIFESANDNVVKNTAHSIAEKIATYKFILSMLCWYDILQRINIISKFLQSHQINIPQCINLIENVTAFLKGYRENGFTEIEINAKDIAAQMNISPEFPLVSQFRLRKRKRFDNERPDEPIIDPRQTFKVEFFNYIIDVALNSLEERFDQLVCHNDTFKFLYNIKDSDVTLDQCKTLESKLYNKNTNSSDINAIELFDEINLYKTTFSDIQQSSLQSPLDVLNKLAENGFLEIFPNLTIAFRILLTIPVSVATGEATFSKLKLIKNYLRSTMTQTRLSDLALLSIESELANNLDYKDVIEIFAKAKARKHNF